MGRQGKGLIALAISVSVAVVPGAPAKTTKYRNCAAVNYQTGGGYYFYKSRTVRARGVKCKLARQIARVHPEDVIGTKNEPRRFKRFGFTCRGRLKGRTVPFTCKSSTKRVTFRWTAQ